MIAKEGEAQHEATTVTATGRPVKDRIATPSAAYSVYRQIREQYRYIAELDARVLGIYNGNPPYSGKELIELGQAWRANFNSREVKAAINAKAEAAFELHMGAGVRAEFKIHPTMRKQTPEPVPELERILAEEYTELMNRWKEGYFQIDLATRESLKFGLGIMVWENEWDWRPKAYKKSNFYVDPACKALPEEIQAFCLRDEWDPQDLYSKIEDPNAAAAEGWNVAAVRRVLINTYIGGMNARQRIVHDGSYDLWTQVEQMIKNNDPGLEAKAFERVGLVHIGVQEADTGEVTHIIIPEHAPEGQMEFLLKIPRRFAKMRQLLWMLPYGYEDGAIGSLRGLGHELYTYGEISNRLLCSALDGGMIAGGLLLQAQTGFDEEQLTIMRNGPVTYIPPGLQAVQSTFSPPITQLLALRAMFRDIATNNVGSFKSLPEFSGEGSRGTEKTARQVAAEESKEVRYEKNKANFEYLMWQNWHEEIWRRITNPEYILGDVDYPGKAQAKVFIMSCVERGVPIELFFTPGAIRIKVAKVIGLGSPGARMDITNQMMSLRGAMDETGRRYTERDWLAARMDYDSVDKYFPLRNRDKLPVNEMSIATLENNDFTEGKSVPVGSDQVHALHLDQVHFPLLMNMAKAVTQPVPGKPADLKGIYLTFQAALPHCYTHVQYLAQDPTRKEYVDKALKLIKQLTQIYQQVERQLGAQAKAQQSQQQAQQAAIMEQMRTEMSQENQVKMREIELKAELERMKQASLNDMRADKTAAQMEIKKWQAEQQASLEQWKAQESASVDRYLAQVKAELERLKRLTAAPTEGT